MNAEFIYVLDYSDTTLNCILLNNEDDTKFETTEELLAHYGFKADQCAWMFSSVELDISYINFNN